MAISTEPSLLDAPEPSPRAAGPVIETFDPRTGTPLAVVPDVDAEGVRAAVARARSAAAGWSALRYRERAAHLLRVRDRLLDRA